MQWLTIRKGGLLDCFGGQQDLHDRVIRSVGPALLRFEEDALRILRVLRFQAVCWALLWKNRLNRRLPKSAAA